MEQKPFKRRIYLIDKKFQLKYAFNILIFIFVTFCIFSVIYYQVGFLPLVEKLKNVYPQARLFSILRSVYRQLFISVFLLLVMAFGFAVYGSHVIAGPLFRLRSHLNRMSQGDFSRKLAFRAKDELSSLADGVNKLDQNICLLIAESRNFAERMRLELNELHGEVKNSPEKYASFSQRVSRLEAEVEQFRKVFKEYKI